MALASEPSVIVLDDGQAHDVFEVLGITDGVARVRSAYLFELGEELVVRVTTNGTPLEMQARVRKHVGSGELRVTELELAAAELPAAPDAGTSRPVGRAR